MFSYSNYEHLDSNDIFPPMITELKEGLIQKNEKDRLKGLYDIIMNGSILQPVNFFSKEENAVIRVIKIFEQNRNNENYLNCLRVIDDNAQKLSPQCCKYVREHFINPMSKYISSDNTIDNDRKTRLIKHLEFLDTEL